jgi:RNA polymerase sigma-70 factor (ECF subfamily)
VQVSDEPSTDELLARAARADGAAVDELLDRHRERLRRMVAVRMGNQLAGRLDPSDIVQETMMVAAQRLPKYLRRPPIGFYPWLRQIAWDRIIEAHRRHLRSQRRSVGREQPKGPLLSDESIVEMIDRLGPRGSSPSHVAARDELRQCVRDELDRLPERDRETLILLYLEQLRPREVAEVLGLTEKAVHMRHLRALHRLRQRLEVVFKKE